MSTQMNKYINTRINAREWGKKKEVVELGPGAIRFQGAGVGGAATSALPSRKYSKQKKRVFRVLAGYGHGAPLKTAVSHAIPMGNPKRDTCRPILLMFLRLFIVSFDLPEMWRKHCVSVAIARPEARAVAKSTDDTLAPTPTPAAAPQTMNTYMKEARHSLMMDLEWKRNGRRRTSPGLAWFRNWVWFACGSTDCMWSVYSTVNIGCINIYFSA